MKTLDVTTSHIKILETIEYLNDRGYYPIQEGVYKIVTGVSDDEMKSFLNVPTFGTLISFGSKKVSRFILMLTRYGYLDKVYHPQSNELLIRITEFGRGELLSYRKKHKQAFKQKTVAKKTTIYKI